MQRLVGFVAFACLAGIPAAADPAPKPPDFSQAAGTRTLDRSFAASSSDSEILPSDDVGFGLDSTVLTADDEATLGLAAHWLAVHPRAHLVVVAHADPSGSAAHNEDLAVRRGWVIRDYLMSSGIETSRIVLVTCGARGNASRRADLIASNSADDAVPSCDH